MNIYRIAAYAVFWLHWAWTVVLFGGFFVQWASPQYAPVEAIALAFTLASQARWKRCPLTIFEDALRAKGGMRAEATGDSFIRRNFEKWLGIRIRRGAVAATLTGMFFVSTALSCFAFFP
ncbi:MAG: DUF2784 family protein [Candidatus Liptonbacteria bacterium]|nr:DUF2784 family protein [Candidatus Liptonbacteria bacterium]